MKNKVIKLGILSFIGVIIGLSTGCASFNNRVPAKAIIKPNNTVVYFTKRDSIPKDAIYRPYALAKRKADANSQAIDPALVGAVLEVIPKMSDSILSVRENVVLSDTELYISGVNINSEDIANMLKTLRTNVDSAK